MGCAVALPTDAGGRRQLWPGADMEAHGDEVAWLAMASDGGEQRGNERGIIPYPSLCARGTQSRSAPGMPC